MAVSAAELQQLYLAYFGRPADKGGLAYYTAQANLTLWDVAAAFSASPESQALYGPGFGAAAIQRIYQNLFNRDAEAAGVLYWSQQVAAGKLSAAGAALGILLGAQGTDAVTLQNKLSVASVFSDGLKSAGQLAGYSGDFAAGAAREFLSGIGSDRLAAMTAIAHIDSFIPVKVIDQTTTGVTLDNMPSGGTLVLTADSQGDTIHVTGADTGSNDRLGIELSKAGALSGASVTAAHVETIAITASDTTTNAAAGTHTDALALVADAATSISIGGNANLALTAAASTHLVTVDASALTGALTFSANGSGQHVIGGAGADVLQSAKGHDVLTGGGGKDVFSVGAPASLNEYATVTDASVGDIIKLANTGGGTARIAVTRIELASTAVFQDYANAAADAGGDASANPAIGWFQWAGDTYLVASEHNAAATRGFANGVDVIVKLTGLHDLSTASLNATAGAAALVQINS